MNFPTPNLKAWSTSAKELVAEASENIKNMIKTLFLLSILGAGYYLGSNYNLTYRDFMVASDACGNSPIAIREQSSFKSLSQIKFICSSE